MAVRDLRWAELWTLTTCSCSLGTGHHGAQAVPPQASSYCEGKPFPPHLRFLSPLRSSNPGPTLHTMIDSGSCSFPRGSMRPLSLEVHTSAPHPGHETPSLLVLGQKWKQDVAELVLWIQEKGLRAADEPSWEPGNILQQLKRLQAAERELLATCGHMEGLQQVGAPDRGDRACSSSNPQPRWMACFHGTNQPRKTHSQLPRT